MPVLTRITNTTEGPMTKGAEFSPCGAYRYQLMRKWGPGCLVFIMLNPSTADSFRDDPTIRKCMHYARREGSGGLFVINVYAYRATNPKELAKVDDPTGPENWQAFRAAQRAIAGKRVKVVAAWGAHDVETSKDVILSFFPDMDCLGTTQDGSPRHPLYVRNDQPLIPYARNGVVVTPGGSSFPTEEPEA